MNQTSKNKYFRDTYDLEVRKKECARILERYPDRIPVIVERELNCDDVPDINKKKYLVPNDLTMGQFIYVIRRRIGLSPDKALYLFTHSGKLPPTNAFLNDMYQKEKDTDGFLYFTYTGQSTFGFFSLNP